MHRIIRGKPDVADGQRHLSIVVLELRAVEANPVRFAPRTVAQSNVSQIRWANTELSAERRTKVR